MQVLDSPSKVSSGFPMRKKHHVGVCTPLQKKTELKWKNIFSSKTYVYIVFTLQ